MEEEEEEYSSFLFFMLIVPPLCTLLIILYLLRCTRDPGISGKAPPYVRSKDLGRDAGWLDDRLGLSTGISFLQNPTKYLSRLRSVYGDIFCLQIFGFRMVFMFSKRALERFYRLSETEASFTEATRCFLGLKLPASLLQGDMKMFHQIMKRPLMEKYLEVIFSILQEHIRKMNKEGTFNTFDHFRQLVHKIGLACWAGREALEEKYFDRLVSALEQLDPEKAFVNPAGLFMTIVTGKRKEKQAVKDISNILKQIWLERQGEGRVEGDTLESLHQLHSDLPDEQRYEQVGIDIFILHIASQANLYAALSWTLVNLLQYPKYLNKVQEEVDRIHNRYLDEGACDELLTIEGYEEMEVTEQCIYESLRLAQQSLTLRKVIKPVEFPDEDFTIQPGYYIATLLSVTNTDKDIVLNKPENFKPERYARNLMDNKDYHLRSPQISTFGHGRHACVGERFALCTMKMVIGQYLRTFRLEKEFEKAEIIATQMGAVGRPTAPCPVAYKEREDRRYPESLLKETGYAMGRNH